MPGTRLIGRPLLVMDQVCEWMVNISQLYDDLIGHRLEQVFELRESELVPIQVKGQLLLQVLR